MLSLSAMCRRILVTTRGSRMKGIRRICGGHRRSRSATDPPPPVSARPPAARRRPCALFKCLIQRHLLGRASRPPELIAHRHIAVCEWHLACCSDRVVAEERHGPSKGDTTMNRRHYIPLATLAACSRLSPVILAQEGNSPSAAAATMGCGRGATVLLQDEVVDESGRLAEGRDRDDRSR